MGGKLEKNQKKRKKKRRKTCIHREKKGRP